MTVKTERLVKRLASLFIDFSLKDWEPVLDELRQSSAQKNLGHEIERQLKVVADERARVRTSASSKRKKPARAPTKTAVVKANDDPELASFQSAIMSKKMLTSIGSLNDALVVVGAKPPARTSRSELVARLFEHLRCMPLDTRSLAIARLVKAEQPMKQDKGQEFQRWIDLIMQTKPNLK